MVGADGAGADEAQPAGLGEQCRIDPSDGAHHQGIDIAQVGGRDIAPGKAHQLAKGPEAGLGGGDIGIDKDSQGHFQ